MQYFADEVELNTLVFWTFGDLGNTGWTDVGRLAVMVVLVSLYFYGKRWDFNALLSGE